MPLSEKDAPIIERLSAAAFSLDEIAEVLECDKSSFKTMCDIEDHWVRKAVRTGYLRRVLELRERMFKDAKNGSSPAQNIAHKLLEDVVVKNML